MGRTPKYFNTDFNVMHDFKPFKNHEDWRMRFEFSVFNLFNNDTVTGKYTEYTHTIDNQINVDSIASIFSQGIDVMALRAAQGIRVYPQSGQPIAFQAPRSARLQLSFHF
jgi:hypothetical protein